MMCSTTAMDIPNVVARTGRFVHFVCVSVFVCACCSSESPTHYPSPRPHVETHGLIDLRQEFLMYTTKLFVFMCFVAGLSGPAARLGSRMASAGKGMGFV